MRIFGLTVLVLLLTAATASAATPFNAGGGSDPSVAVGSDGTGHVVWRVDAGDVKVGYCRVGAQAESCNRREDLAFPGVGDANDAGRPHVFVTAPGRVILVATCWNCGAPSNTTNRTYRWISTNNGDSFGTPVEIGNGTTAGGFGTLLADETFVGVDGSRAKAAQPGGSGVQFVTGWGSTFGSDIARDPISNHLVAATNNLSEIRHGVFRGANTASNLNTDDADWVKDQGLIQREATNRSQSLAPGPRGLFMAYEATSSGDQRVGLRQYSPATFAFGPPSYVEGSDAIDAAPDELDSFQDAAGRLHLVWRSLHDGGRLRYRVSDPSGASFGAAANLATRESFVEPELGAGGDGRGFATWGSQGSVRVVPLDPRPEPAPPSTGGGGGGSTTTPPPAPSAAGTTYTGPTRARVTRVPGASITLTAPRGCVARGQSFRVRLAWKRQRRKGNLFVKIFRVDFYVGTRVVRTDRRPPFVHTVTVSAGSTPGSTVTVRARASIKVKRGRGPKKSISTTVNVCS